MANKCLETNSDKVLVVRDIATTLGIADQFNTTTGFIDQMKGRKAAFVNPHPFVDDEMDFAITVARNRGGNFSLFRDLKSAEDWLLAFEGLCGSFDGTSIHSGVSLRF